MQTMPHHHLLLKRSLISKKFRAPPKEPVRVRLQMKQVIAVKMKQRQRLTQNSPAGTKHCT